MGRLLTIEEAAAELGVPKGSVRTAAEQHNLLVRMGRAIRIDPETLGELIQLCRENPQEHASTSAAVAYSPSETAPDSSTRAHEIAEELTRPSRDTSPKRTGRSAAQLLRIK